LVRELVLAEAGHEVVCTDIDQERIAKLNAGGVPIYEEHLEQILASARKASGFRTRGMPVKRSVPAMPFSFAWARRQKIPARQNLSAIDNVAGNRSGGALSQIGD